MLRRIADSGQSNCAAAKAGVEAAMFLLGDGAGYITGTTAHVNGGMYV